jgi:hypothetical protein
MSNELTIIVPEDDKTRLVIFTSKDGLDPFLKTIRDEIDAFKPDISTAKGRDEIKSMAYKVARSKTLLDEVGEKLYHQYKAIPDNIQASRRDLKKKLDSWRDEVRKPLTEWENKEEDRKQKHTDALAAIKKLMSANSSEPPETLRGYIDRLRDLTPKGPCEEFFDQYKTAITNAEEHLATVLAAAETREADALELDRIRAENARLAEENRKAEEERQKAKDEAEAAKKREQEARQREENARLEAELSRKREEEAKAKQEETARKAEEDRQMRIREVEKAKRDAEEREKKAAEAAREEERKRQQQEQEEREAYMRKRDDACMVVKKELESLADEVIRGKENWSPSDIVDSIWAALCSDNVSHLKIEV